MRSSKLIGFLVNPIAGMGGKVGLKGTDGIAQQALDLGAEASSNGRAVEALARFQEIKKGYPKGLDAEWLTCSSLMGEETLKEAGFGMDEYSVVYDPSDPDRTTAQDTKSACEKFRQNKTDLVIFCGGDGTARDVLSVIGQDIPMLGIPAGVKMHSGVFCVNPRTAGEMIVEYLYGTLEPTEVEIMDLDEELYRTGEWNIELFGTAMTPWEPGKVQSAKMLITESQEAVLDDIAFFIQELMEENPKALFLLGPGGTLKHVGDFLGVEKALLGIDAVANKALLASDVNEEGILNLLDNHQTTYLVVSPIGAQGFILGRGNLQLSPEVIRRIGIDNIMILMTNSKLSRTGVLRVDTGDNTLDAEFLKKKYLPVIIGDRTKKLVPVE